MIQKSKSMIVAFYLLFGVFSFSISAPQPDYTIESAIKKLISWGIEVTNYNSYRMEKSKTDLFDQMTGATISIPKCPIESQNIQVVHGIAQYKVCIALENIDVALDLDDKYEGLDLHNTSTSETTRIWEVCISLTDTSDRMAMELQGLSHIDVLGRIKNFSMDEHAMNFDISMTSWKKTRENY